MGLCFEIRPDQLDGSGVWAVRQEVLESWSDGILRKQPHVDVGWWHGSSSRGSWQWGLSSTIENLARLS